MIAGIGIDLVDIARVESLLARFPERAATKLFTERERKYALSRANPARHFAALARSLHARGWRIWLLGSARDAPITAQIQRLADGICVDLAGRTTLDEAMDLLSLASRAVTNDSGLMHVAAALERPTVAIFGSSSPAFTPPLSSRARVISLNLACSPCFARTCPAHQRSKHLSPRAPAVISSH